MNNDITTILNQINILYNRKINLEQLISLLNDNKLKGKYLFSEDGKFITKFEFGLNETQKNEIWEKMPPIIIGGVQTASYGAIQDPAGTAIGINAKPINSGAGGGSEAIYKEFPKLNPIPPIKEGESIFNSTTEIGKKILHTHSYTLHGNPKSNEDRLKVIENIKDSYYNAFVTFNDKKSKLDKKDRNILNLVPVSASIFANDFAIKKKKNLIIMMLIIYIHHIHLPHWLRQSTKPMKKV